MFFWIIRIFASTVWISTNVILCAERTRTWTVVNVVMVGANGSEALPPPLSKQEEATLLRDLGES